MFQRNKVSEGAEILEHWFTLVPQHHFSTQEFYDAVSSQIAAQKLPSLDVSRVDLAEGGSLSDRREYLRMARERLTFDVCAAPVGTNYFFSYRFYLLPAVLKPWEILLLTGGILCGLYLFVRMFGVVLGPILLAVIFGLCVWLMRNAIGRGLHDLDASLMKIPVIGSVYQRYFRKDTFYREDVRIAYCSIVSAIVKEAAEDAMGTKGLNLRRTFEYAPYLERYRAVAVSPPLEPA